MFGRTSKPPVKQGRNRPVRDADPQRSPAFSYYASNRPEPTAPRRTADRQIEQPSQGRERRKPRFSLAQAPFWLFMVVVVVCGLKLLLLNTNPKVLVVGNSSVTNTYVQSTAVYGSAAHKLLAGSIMNRTKLTANISGTTQALQREFPELQTASLTVPLVGNRPVLYVQAAPPSVVLQTVHGNYALNKSGIVLAKLQSIPGAVPTLNDQVDSGTPTIGSAYLPGTTVSFIQTVAYQFAAAKVPASTFVLPSSNLYELDMHLEGKSYIVRYNLQDDALEQSGAALAVIQKFNGNDPKSYLDVRTPERVYYK